MKNIIQDTIEEMRSGVCKLEFLNDSGEVVNSGSGFIYRDQIVTNSHVFHPEGHNFPADTKMRITFGNDEIHELTFADLNLVAGSEENSADYAVYKTSAFEIGKKYGFELSGSEHTREGDEVLIFGFPFETRYLTTHHGRISALFNENGLDKIQVDASVNQGNSGGPLLHLSSGQVIGIVTRKQTGLTKDFDDMISAMRQNVEVLEKARGGIVMSGVDTIKAFRSIQEQMLRVSRNIKRSANTGIAYAFSCKELIRDLSQ